MANITAVALQPVKRGYLIWLWIGIAAALLMAAALAWAAPEAIRVTVLTPGQGGAHPTDADVVLVNYIGKLENGTVFDQSRQPTPFPVKSVVPGFSQGLKLMTKGEKIRLIIPPSLGYGDKETGPIPANSTLVFDVELVDFIPEAVLRQQMQAQQAQQAAMMSQGGMSQGGMSQGGMSQGAMGHGDMGQGSPGAPSTVDAPPPGSPPPR